MVWARLDDEMLDNPKIAKAGPIGFALHVAAIVWCCRNLTDGLVPYARCNALLDLSSVDYDVHNPCAVPKPTRSIAGETGLDAHVVADHLVEIGLWESTPDGYLVHDFLEYNPSRADVLKQREKVKTRVAKHRGNAVGNGVTNQARNGLGNGVSTPSPDPDPLEDTNVSSITTSKRKRSKRLVAFPAEFVLTDELIAGAKERGIEDPQREFDHFKEHHLAKGSTFVNWTMAFWKWCRNSHQFRSKPTGATGTADAHRSSAYKPFNPNEDK